MREPLRKFAFWTLGLLLLGAAAWWWFDTMERKWVAVERVSSAAQKNRLLAAARLLRRHGYETGTHGTLAELLLAPIPAGTLILGENGGTIALGQSRQLLAWVAAGNTLIARPRWASDRPDDPERQAANGGSKAKRIEHDPIGAYLGVRLASQPAAGGAVEKPPSRLASLTLPQAPYALQLDAHFTRLTSSGQAKTALFADDAGEAVRVYREGKGHIALLAENYFDNVNLNRYDHAELLLGLARLNSSRNVSLVQRLDVLPWYQALWAGFAPAIAGLGCVLVLLLWTALRRFGPLLPEPEQERRALMEHIDAVGRWLCKMPAGREILLAAAREATEKVLRRRAPQLQGLPAVERMRRLAQVCGLPEADVGFALQQPASKVPIQFTRQVHTLQKMRNHYER